MGIFRALESKLYKTLMAVFLCVFSWSNTNTEGKIQEGEMLYRLWFVLHLNGSVHSAFCRCKSGTYQGCRHLDATLFEPDGIFFNQRKSFISVSAYCYPKPMPANKPVPISEMKTSTTLLGKRKVTTHDDS